MGRVDAFLSSLFYDSTQLFLFFTCTQLKRVGVKILRFFLRQLLTRASWNRSNWTTGRYVYTVHTLYVHTLHVYVLYDTGYSSV
jgi:hypothetical protein